MRKKQVRHPLKSGTKENTSSSEDEKMKSATRRSSRKKMSVGTSRDSGVEVSMVDSAYEADDSARSDASPPKQPAVDEYHIDSIEDVPEVPQARKRKNGLQTKQSKGAKKMKKIRTNLNISTSTPVYEGDKSRNQLITPEVTPILAVGRNNRPPKINDDSTPTISRPLRKRSFSFHDPDLSAISAQLSFDSQGDSGIASPALKKIKSSKVSTSSLHVPLQKSSKLMKEKEKSSKISERSPTSIGSSKTFKRNQNILNPPKWETYSSVKGKAVLRESSMNRSCFGFDSIQTPSPVSRPKPKKVKKPVKKSSKSPSKAYRSPKDSSDSIFDVSPGARIDSASIDTDSQENILSHGSPSLFSDIIFSEDGDVPTINKWSNKSYKGFKAKLKKSKPQVSKLDAWASSFNMELENIEKFDLNIE